MYTLYVFMNYTHSKTCKIRWREKTLKTTCTTIINIQQRNWRTIPLKLAFFLFFLKLYWLWFLLLWLSLSNKQIWKGIWKNHTSMTTNKKQWTHGFFFFRNLPHLPTPHTITPLSFFFIFSLSKYMNYNHYYEYIKGKHQQRLKLCLHAVAILVLLWHIHLPVNGTHKNVLLTITHAGTRQFVTPHTQPFQEDFIIQQNKYVLPTMWIMFTID